jgi:phosphatidate cytidylyltransferase
LTEAQFESIQWILLLGCVWWAVALLWVQTYPQSALLWGYRLIRAAMGLLVLVPAWVALTFVRAQEQGAWLLLLMAAIVACADIGGYFTGRRWGRRKLALAVSPGKTWEGFAGGVVANLLLALVLWLVIGGSFLLFLALILPASLVSVLGDLLESMLKRHRGIKDSSALLPGHGGVLDRIDSLTAAAPVFALVLLSIGGTLG